MAAAADAARAGASGRRWRRSARWRATTTSSRCATRSSTTARRRSRRSSSCAGESETPAFLLESAEQGQRVGRYSFIGVRPREVVRWSLGDDGDPYAIAGARPPRCARRRSPDVPPFAGGAVGFFGYDLVRTVEPLGEPNPDVARAARHGAHALRRARRLRPPQAHGHDAGQRRRRASDVERLLRRRGRDDRRRRRALLAGPVPRPADRRGQRADARRSSPTCRASTSRAWSRGSSSTSTPATPSRSCRPSAGAAELGVDPFSRLPRAARGQPVALHVLPGLRGLPDRRREPRAAADGRPAGTRRRARSPAPGRAARRRRGRPDRRRAARRREGARRARDARRPRPQRPRAASASTARVEVDTFMARRDLLARHAHRLQRSRARCARASARWTRCARSCPRGRCRARRRCGRWRSSTSSSRSSAAATAARSATCRYSGDLDTCIHIRTVVVKDGVAHIQAGGGTVADAKPAYEYEESVTKARGRAAGDRARRAQQPEWAVSMQRPRRRQLRLLHLQPRPVPGRARGARSTSCATTAPRSTSCSRAGPTASSSRPGPCTPERGGHLARGRAPVPRGAACRRSASASATSRWPRPSAARSSATSPSTARRPRSSHDGAGVFARPAAGR